MQIEEKINTNKIKKEGTENTYRKIIQKGNVNKTMF